MDKNRVARNSRQVRPLFDPFRLPVFQDRRPFPGLRVFQKGYRPIEALPRLYRNHVLMERTPNTTLALDFLDVFHAQVDPGFESGGASPTSCVSKSRLDKKVSPTGAKRRRPIVLVLLNQS